MAELLAKLKSWIPTNIASLLGIAQAVVKFGKEVCSLFLNLIAPLIPGPNDDAIVIKIRNIFNLLDGAIEKIKEWLLKI
jgi:hypothetical protein